MELGSRYPLTVLKPGQLAIELEALEVDPALAVEANLSERARVLDLIKLAQKLAALQYDPALVALTPRLVALKERLVVLDERLFTRLRARIRRGVCDPAALRRVLERYTRYRPTEAGQVQIGYDDLDLLVDGLLAPDPPPQPTLVLPSESVHYEPTPARLILELVDRTALGPEDVFYDLGAGLGQVALLVHLLSGARAVGVEREPAFCAYARRAAAQLGLARVTFLEADARDLDYADGAVFYLFTPFTGRMLQDVLVRLRAQALRRPLTLCSYGPCTPDLARQTWLEPDALSAEGDAERVFRLAVFRSRP